MHERYDDSDRFPDEILKSLMGGEYDFYGVDNTTFCIGKGGSRMVLEAVEDPDDGYRSYFGCFRVPDFNKIFFRKSIARVRFVEESGHDITGWKLIDVDNDHEWLHVGTDYSQDYYPCFVFEYRPDTSRTIEEERENV